MSKFVGRLNELDLLRSWQGDRSLMTAIYGRRRIGKTRLIEESAKGFTLIKFEGLEGQSASHQRRHFRDTLARISGMRAHAALSTSSWEDLLLALSEYLADKPSIVFFDEFQWMAAGRNELVSTLKFVWDNHFKAMNRMHLIICGSVSSFIVKNVIRSKALYGRIDYKINLGPLQLNEVKDGFFPNWSREECLRIYLALGGVPKYLEMCDPLKSFEQNMIELFFKPLAPFTSELETLFISHFGQHSDYSKVIGFLSGKKYATRTEIANHLNVKSGGAISTVLGDLELAGFIEKLFFVKGLKNTKDIYYRICDPFLRFYYKFINPLERKIKLLKAPMSIHEAIPSQLWQVWQGYAFEALCHSHADKIAKALGFSAVEYEFGSVAASKHTSEIDLVYSRKDGVMTICEIKSGQVVGKEVLIQARSQVESLQKCTKKTVQVALIALGKVERSVVESRLFVNIVGLDAFFN